MQTLKTRIKQRHDSLSDWESNNIVLLDGELAVVECQSSTRFKIGDGTKAFNDLPFVDQYQLSTISAYASSVVIGDANVSSALSIDFNGLVNTNAESTYLSDLHSTDQIKTWQNAYRMVDEILVETGAASLNYSLTRDELVEKVKEDIIRANCKEIFGIDSIYAVDNSEPLKQFYLSATSDLTPDAIVQSLQLVLNGLKAKSYSLATKLKSIENSIDSLETSISAEVSSNYFPLSSLSSLETDQAPITSDGYYVKLAWQQNGKVEVIQREFKDDCTLTSMISSNVSAAIDSLDFTGPSFIDNGKVKVLTSISQTNGKIDAQAKTLSYKEIDGLSNAIDDKLSLSAGGVVSAGVSIAGILSADQILVDGAIDGSCTTGIAIGNSKLDHSNSFVWSGTSTTRYSSKGNGTFSIDPISGLSGIYIGSKTLQTIFDNQIAIARWKSPIQFIKPTCDEPMTLKLTAYSDADCQTSVICADSYAHAAAFKYFLPNGSESKWVQLDDSSNDSPQYFPRACNNMPVEFDMRNLALSASIDLTQYNRLYLKYQWTYELSGTIHISDPASMVVPSRTEVGANAQDTVGKSDFQDLYQNVIVETYQATIDGQYYHVHSTKYNTLPGEITDAKIVLEDYNEHKTYKIDFTTGTLSDGASTITWYVGTTNGSIEYSDALNTDGSSPFVSNKHYLVEVRDGHIFINDATNIVVQASGSGGSGGYALETAALSSIESSLCCKVNDHTITTIPVSSDATPIVVVLPPKQATTARDFILRIEVSSSTAPAFTFSGLDETLAFDAESDDWAVIEPGLNIVSFTETK